MKEILILFIAFFCIVFKNCSQSYITYYNLINEAEFEIYNNENDRAIKLIKQAFKVENPLSKDCYLLATCLAKQDSKKNLTEIKALLRTASKNGDIKSWMSENPLDIKLKESFLTKLYLNSEEWFKKTQPIRDTIKYFTAKDQEYRKVFHDSIEVYYKPKSKEFHIYKKLMIKNDSLTQVQFLNYIRQNGYPGTQRAGTGRVGVILLHLNENLINEFDTLLLAQLKKGNIYPYYYGSMIDRYNHVLAKKAEYFAYFNTVDTLDSNQVIENRLNIGMSPYFQGPRRFVNISNSTLLKLP